MTSVCFARGHGFQPCAEQGHFKLMGPWAVLQAAGPAATEPWSAPLTVPSPGKEQSWALRQGYPLPPAKAPLCAPGSCEPRAPGERQSRLGESETGGLWQCGGA